MAESRQDGAVDGVLAVLRKAPVRWWIGPPEGFVDRLFQFDADSDGKLMREELAKMGEQVAQLVEAGKMRGKVNGVARNDSPTITNYASALVLPQLHLRQMQNSMIPARHLSWVFCRSINRLIPSFRSK